MCNAPNGTGGNEVGSRYSSYAVVRNLGPLFAAEQSQPRRGDFAEHWASLDYACFLVSNARPMHAAIA